MLWDEPDIGLKRVGFRIRMIQDDVERRYVAILEDDLQPILKFFLF